MVATPTTLLEDRSMIDDAAILDGAASVWAFVTFAADLPTTPEQKKALEQARAQFLEYAEALGVTETAIKLHLIHAERGLSVASETLLH